ncbi:uncharacterized protein BDW43DRAFT_309641 [Aspergillus alliaceus]|uniref:uncharacterized protein n=1 Tax=Petromyces alliaceus TaxID=209559 RepID=UPI0012A63D4A|nr:uncharacterized protein BDW43DRAFT_309641 [Aspergillus alliaceus]KAB8235275.1 hypothetical protein BDW43DRAFT_309641 [Aspergillus alliaceus]
MGHTEMRLDRDIRDSTLPTTDRQLLNRASIDSQTVDALPESASFLGAFDLPSYTMDLANLLAWGPSDPLNDVLNKGTGLNSLDSICQQFTVPPEPSPDSQSPMARSAAGRDPRKPLPTATVAFHESDQSSSHERHEQSNPAVSSPMSSTLSLASYGEDDIVIAENLFHVSAVPVETYEKIHSFYETQTGACFKRLAFPDIDRLNCFVQLYFEHFHPQMPFLHPNLFENDGSWVLVLAVAAIGSQYTRMVMREQYAIVLSGLLREAIPLDAVKALQYNVMTLAQCTLLLNFSLLFNGYRGNILNLQFLRTWLAVLIRPFLKSPNERDLALLDLTKVVNVQSRWHAWLQAEARSRLAYSFFIFDSFCVLYLDSQSNCSMDDFQQRLPYSDELWSIRDAHDWELHLKYVHDNPVHSLQELLSSSCRTEFSLEKLSEFSKLTLLLGLFVGEKQFVNASQFSSRYLDSRGYSSASLNSQTKSSTYRTLDSRYKLLVPNINLVSSNSVSSHNLIIYYHLTSILRYTSLRNIYAYTGWLVTRAESTAAGNRLSLLMKSDQERARTCVVHAGALIREIRGVSSPACYHYLSFLMAFLYLRVYVRLQTSTPNQASLQNQPSPCRLVRIDRDPDEALVKQWIVGDPHCRPYLTGVGLLLEPGVSTRLIKECQRMLGSHDAWPHFRNGISSCLDQLAGEVNPLTDIPYSWDSP